MNRELKEFTQIEYGKSPNGYRVDYSAYPILGTGGQTGFSKIPLFTDKGVLVGRKGTLGNPIYVDKPCWVIDTAYLVIPERDIDAKWLYYNLSNFNLEALNEATGVPSISRDYLYRVSFRWFEPKHQQKIAKILTTVDELIEKTEGLIAKYQAVKQGMMHDLFTRGVDEHGHLRPPYEEAPHLYHETPLGWLPKEWGTDSFALACELIKDGTHLPPKRVEDGVLLLSVQNMIDGKFQLTDSDTKVPYEFYQQMHKNWKVQPNDVLMAVVGATIGKTCSAPSGFPLYTLQRSVAVLRGKEKYLSNIFLYYYLSSVLFQNRLWERVNQTAQPGIYLNELGPVNTTGFVLKFCNEKHYRRAV